MLLILILVSGILNLIMGLVFIFNSKRKEGTITFALFSFATFIWSLFNFFIYKTNYPIFVKLSYSAGAAIVTFLLAWVFRFSQKADKKLAGEIIFIYLIGIVFFLLPLFDGLVVSNIVKNNSGGFNQTDGLLFPLYLVFIFACYVIVLTKLIILFRRSSKLERKIIKVILIGFSIYGGLSLIFGLILPFFGYEKLIDFDVPNSIIFVIFTTYAITRYRFMDIRIVARKIFIYLGAAAFTYGIFYLIAWLYAKFLGGVFSSPGFLLGLIIAPAFVALLFWFNKSITKFANKYLFYSLYNYQETINELSRKLNHLTNLDQIVNLIVDTIKQTMQLDRAGILLINVNKKPVHYQIAKIIGFNEQNGINLVKDDFLTQYLQKNQKPLVKEELSLISQSVKASQEKSGLEKLQSKMQKIEASLCLPLLSSNRLIGIIVLGAKISGDAYTKEDIELLNTLAYQAGIALDNARLYSNMQVLVNEQTKDIRELLQIKSDFLTIASHELRTPVSIVRGYLSMVHEGSIKGKQKEQFIESAFTAANSLEEIVHDLLTVTEIEGGKVILKVQPEDLAPYIADTVSLRNTFAKEKNINLSFIQPAKNFPKVLIDKIKINDIIGNLVTNAIHYTPKNGTITVSLALQEKPNPYAETPQEPKKMARFSIKDTGIGFTAEDKRKLFQKFSRAKEALAINPSGAGMGLYVVKLLAEQMGGWVEADSPGPNQGSTFSVYFRVA